MNKFVQHFESSLLSKKYPIGSTLPSIGELAEKLNLDPQVVHEGITELTNRGLVSMIPDIGTVVNDYRKYGSFYILNLLFNYEKGSINIDTLKDLLDIRKVLETHTARLAARNRTNQHLSQYEEIIFQERTINKEDIPGLVDLDFKFHQLTSIASGNTLYPVLINSFRTLYTHLVAVFFTNENVIEDVLGFHYEFISAVKEKDEEKAAEVMLKIVTHGENFLYSALGNDNQGNML